MIRLFMGAAVAVATFSVAVPSFAHTTLEVRQATIGSSYKAVLRPGHGCQGEPTIVLRVQIPEGFFNVKPMPKAGWQLETVIGPYENTYENHGATLTEGVKEIIWSGGELPDDWYDEFIFRGTFADSLQPGSFYFPTVQECPNGEDAWIDTSGAEDAEKPAPRLELVSGEDGH